MPPTAMNPNKYCQYTFNFPSDSYATLMISATGVTPLDYITVYDSFNDNDFELDRKECSGPGCETMSSNSSWPGIFTVMVYTGHTTFMKVQMTVTIKKLGLNNVVKTISTMTDYPGYLIYFQDFKQNTAYSLTSQSSKVRIQVASVPSPHDGAGHQAQLSNIFVYENGVSRGTLEPYQAGAFIGTNVTLYAAHNVNLRGAIFVTDQSNVASLLDHHVEYEPYTAPDATSYASIDGGTYPPKEGAVTIIGDKGVKGPIDIRQLMSYNNVASFSYRFFGPTASHKLTNTPITNSDLPVELDGALNMYTIYVDQGTGIMKYTIPTA